MVSLGRRMGARVDPIGERCRCRSIQPLLVLRASLRAARGGFRHQLRQQQPVLPAKSVIADHHLDAGPATQRRYAAKILTRGRYDLVARHPDRSPTDHSDVSDIGVRASVQPVQQVAGHRWVDRQLPATLQPASSSTGKTPLCCQDAESPRYPCTGTRIRPAPAEPANASPSAHHEASHHPPYPRFILRPPG